MYSLDCMSAFHIREPHDTYIYDILSLTEQIATISSDDCLRILDPTALEGSPLVLIKNVNADVTCLGALQDNERPNIICTAGRDGMVCLVDVRNKSVVGKIVAGEC